MKVFLLGSAAEISSELGFIDQFQFETFFECGLSEATPVAKKLCPRMDLLLPQSLRFVLAKNFLRALLKWTRLALALAR